MSDKSKIISIILGIIVVALMLVYLFMPWPKEVPEIGEKVPEIGTFEEVVRTLNTSQALVDFLNEYFIIEERPGLVAYSPEEFFEKKKGAAHDFAVFSAYVLKENGFVASVFRFNYRVNDQQGTHVVTVFRDQDAARYLTVTDLGVKMFLHGPSFEDLIRAEEQRLNVKAYEYTFFPAEFNITDLSEPVPFPGYEWIKIN